jgi:cytosine/adenosine deaminase-related metal-dependent hydrolase
MVGAHASFTLSEDSLAACVEAADQEGSGLHIHVAEDRADQTDSVARFGRRVVERLGEAGGLTDRALLAHGVHLEPAEIERIHASGATVVHNPRSNMNNGVGRAPVAALGRALALGTDGIGADLFAESQAAFWRAREARLDTDPAWPLSLLAQGAAAAGAATGEPELGRIIPGAPADLMVLDYAAPAPWTESAMAGHWLFGLGSRWVRDVVVAGEVVVRDGRLTMADQDELAAKAAMAAARLWERMDDVGPHPFAPEGG